MKIGDLVKPVNKRISGTVLVESDWNGIIIAWEGCNPIVFWSEKFPDELEYQEHLEVINEGR